jgi:dihydropteroate synthase
MAIVNVTPDSFSDGGSFLSLDDALRQAEKVISEGADILDIGGESTRPGSNPVPFEEESARIIPAIEAIVKRFDVPISVDTWKAETAHRAMDAGAEIINDISGLRWQPELARVAADSKAGLILMHLRGNFETMHDQPPVANILEEVSDGFRQSVALAEKHGVDLENIALDVGIGFSKTFEQNLELIAKLAKLNHEFARFPMLVGASRKSVIGKALGGVGTNERLNGSLAGAAVAVWNGARIVRVHDVRETVEAIKVVDALSAERFRGHKDPVEQTSSLH